MDILKMPILKSDIFVIFFFQATTSIHPAEKDPADWDDLDLVQMASYTVDFVSISCFHLYFFFSEKCI
jgi:hypothetical protein